jgi:hypothetical protein
MIVGILAGLRLMHEVLRSEAVGNCCKHELAVRLQAVMETCIKDDTPAGKPERSPPRRKPAR